MESIYEYTLEQLERRKGQWTRIASETGISYRTIEKIARKTTRDPGVQKVEKLAAHLKQMDRNDAALGIM